MYPYPSIFILIQTIRCKLLNPTIISVGIFLLLEVPSGGVIDIEKK
jgi:hypothetical protein